MIEYREEKHVDGRQLFTLFTAVGWIKPRNQKPVTERPDDAIANDIFYLDDDGKYDFLTSAFLHSTYVLSAWESSRLVGIIRVLSDGVQRSVIYDLVVHPEYQKRGIGKTLVSRILIKFDKTQITLGTSSRNFEYYKKLGFRQSQNYLEKVSRFY